ncbi:hypothetical protein ACGFWE_41565 [Streptomyces sp. NPDC048523]
MFAETGFKRTTIRAVATAASVDPALVMQYSARSGSGSAKPCRRCPPR